MAFNTVVMATGAATAINVVHVVQTSGTDDVWTPAIAGGVIMVTLSFVNNGVPQIASMLAILFLLGTVLLRGEKFFQSIAQFVSSKG